MQRKCACGGTPGLDGECAECRSKRLASRPRVTDQGTSSAAPPIVHDVLRSPGQPLDLDTRAFMESRLGHDFGRVRVHTDARAAESARVVNALAYAAGSNVVFSAGRYVPETRSGRRLLAHELTHVIQQGSRSQSFTAGLKLFPSGTAAEREADMSAEAAVDTDAAVVRPGLRTPVGVSRQEAPITAGTNISVSHVNVSISSGKIDFHTTAGLYRYDLEQAGLSEGDYTATVTVTGGNVDFTLVEMEGNFNFSYRIRPGQPNPSTFFGNQSTVPFHISHEPAPPLAALPPHEPEPATSGGISLTPEEVMRRCEANDLPGIKVFPFRATRFGAAPVTARREGEHIVVKQPVHVLANDDFREQTKTLPTETFIGGVRLYPNELVRVHVYEPRWYHLNITGSTEGDIEREFCVTGEQMLEIGEASTTATLVNIGLTGVEAATVFVPVGKVATAIGQPLMQAGRTGLAAAMIGTAEVVAPRTVVGAASRAAVTVVEEQAVAQVAGRAMARTVSQTVVQGAERGLAEAVPSAATVVPRVVSGQAASVAGTGMLEAGVETTGSAIRPTVTPGGEGGLTSVPPGTPTTIPPTPPSPPAPASGVMLTTVTGEQVIVDTNVARALDKAVRGLPLQEGERMMVAAAQRQGIVVTERTVSELAVRGGAQGTTMVTREVTATAAERQAIMTELERLGVGGGVPDREIVQQALLSEAAPGVVPIFATADRRVINGLARAAGIDPRRLGPYRNIAEFLQYVRGTNSFEVVVGGRRLIVRPIQPIRGGL